MTTLFAARPGERTRIMGILNVTPDSMSDGGLYDTVDAAVRHAHALVDAGAEIIDVGGESTAPGRDRVSAEVEQSRIIPVVEQLVADGIPTSVDTMNARTAAAVIDRGVTMINDVSGGLADPAMVATVAAADVLFVATHWRAHAATADAHANYDDIVSGVVGDLQRRIDNLSAAGVPRDRLIIDPGFGFSKMASHNWDLLARVDVLASMGYPVLIGASRKRFLGTIVPDHATLADRDVATALVTAFVAGRVWGVRVHDVRSSVTAVRLVEEICRYERQ